MKKVKHLLLITFLAGTITVSGQTINTTQGSPNQPGNVPQIVDVYKRENITPDRKPIPYPFLREADVVWAKDVWRIIDLRQRMNYPLRFPELEPIVPSNRYSLYLLLMEGIKAREITPFVSNDNFNNPFGQPATPQYVADRVQADTVFDDNGDVLRINYNGLYVKGFYVKEKWYFDKQHSEMRVRITALAPLIIRPKYDQNGMLLPTKDRVIPFFVYFDQCRDMFARHPVFNPNNDAQSISFDDLFIQRRFASTIAAESNEFGNRFIVDYLTGQDALMEADRIKNDLFIVEHDMWEY